MGLGKTVEIIALLLANRTPGSMRHPSSATPTPLEASGVWWWVGCGVDMGVIVGCAVWVGGVYGLLVGV